MTIEPMWIRLVACAISPCSTKQSGQNTTSDTPKRSNPARSQRTARSTKSPGPIPGLISASKVTVIGSWGPVSTVARWPTIIGGLAGTPSGGHRHGLEQDAR